jgi:hypothetical protein
MLSVRHIARPTILNLFSWRPQLPTRYPVIWRNKLSYFYYLRLYALFHISYQFVADHRLGNVGLDI